MNARKRTLLRLLKLAPKPVVWRFARTYIAGETLDAAAGTIAALAAEGCTATLDVLGEDVTTQREVDGFASQYRAALDRIAADRLPANVSVKPTAMGLKLSPELAYEVIAAICAHAATHGNFVRIDMEDRTVTQATLDLYRRLRAAGRDNCGVVLQAYLRRTLRDAADVAALGASVRLCKGIYIEPRDVAYQDYWTVRDAFLAALRTLFTAGASRVGIATHDEWLVVRARALIQELGIPKERYEFQMLLGVDPQLRRLIVSEGHPLRVYVPYGAGWHAYSLRRLLENPRFASHVVRNVFGLASPSAGAGR